MPLLCLCGYTTTSVWKTFKRKTFRIQTFKVANDKISMSVIKSKEVSVIFMKTVRKPHKRGFHVAVRGYIESNDISQRYLKDIL